MESEDLKLFLKSLTDKNYANDVFNFITKELNVNNDLEEVIKKNIEKN